MFDKKANVRCIDCGYCGFHINFGRGLKWEEMIQELRIAYGDGKEKQPPGQVPGMGHWNYVECVLNPHSDWHGSCFYRRITARTHKHSALQTVFSVSCRIYIPRAPRLGKQSC